MRKSKNTRSSMPSIKVIDKYWKNKILSEPNWSTILGDSTFENILDYDGDHCYACGVKRSLERAHIVPHGLGGPETPENLFLLCPSCHKENPDTSFPDMFFAYVHDRPCYLSQCYLRNAKGMDSLYARANEEDKKLFNAAATSELSWKIIIDNYEHLLQTQSVSASGELSKATCVALLWKSFLITGRHIDSDAP